MRLAPLIFCLALIPQDAPQDWLRQILEAPESPGLPALEKLVDAAPASGLRALDAVYPKLTTKTGQARWAALLRRLRARSAELPDLKRLQPRTLWALGLGEDSKGRRVLFVDARVFRDAEVPFGAPRRRHIEYLLCQDPPEKGAVSQSFESLAGAPKGELAALLKHWKAERPLVLRWFEGDRLRQAPLNTLLPGARQRPSQGLLRLDEHALDVSSVQGLPADGRALQVGIVIED